MYMVNTYQWDFPLVAALCAPRPLMLCNSDADSIFPFGGVRRLAEKVRRVYDLYGASDKFTVLETSGPHKDTPELRLGAFRWLNRWLKNDNGPVVEKERTPFTPQELKVLDHVPDDAINAKIHEKWILRDAPNGIPKPDAEFAKRWPQVRQQWLDVLKEQAFRNWPKNPPPLNVRLAADIKKDGIRLRAWDYISEDDVELRLWVVTHADTENPKKLEIDVLNEEWVLPINDPGWREFLGSFDRDFAKAFPREKLPLSPTPTNKWRPIDTHSDRAIIVPRGIGPTRWAQPNGKEDTLVRRRFALIGQTIENQQVWDVRRACAVLCQVFDPKTTRFEMWGAREMASIALHATIFEPKIETLILTRLPESYREGPVLLNVLRSFDMPQTLGLAFPKKMGCWVYEEPPKTRWTWPLQLQRSLGQEYLGLSQIAFY
jgi:hypothetical protein